MNIFATICAIIQAILVFLYAQDTKERYPKMKLQPVLYIFLGFFFGFIPAIYLFAKRKRYGKTHNM